MLDVLRPGQDSENPFERDVDPGRPVRELVGHLVDSFFECEERDHLPCELLACGIGPTTTHCLAIGGAKAVDRPLPPGYGELRHSRLRCRPRLREMPDRGDGGVVKRTDHSGDIAKGGALAPPRSDRPCRLSLKINDEEI